MTAAYNKFKEVDAFLRIIPLKEIKENDYNLDVALYVFPEEEMEAIDVNREWKEVKMMGEDIAKVGEKIGKFLKEVKGWGLIFY